MSFVRDPADIYTLRTLTANKVPLIAKIEMAEAVEKLAEIV
jgi:pyruvate kinase